eukprot:GHVR01042610.1.p1 GENE.GHVR01042610.1~~GHVR01042610.1.p1  ORF type:complete len:216 (+),score=60.41 GHVR01042610.1:592-1239(+)
MAPELFSPVHSGGAPLWSTKVDVYAYGILLYEIMSQCTPYACDYDAAQFQSDLCLLQRRPDLSLIPPGCPQIIMDLMVSCWSSDKDKRPDFKSIVSILKGVRPPITPPVLVRPMNRTFNIISIGPNEQRQQQQQQIQHPPIVHVHPQVFALQAARQNNIHPHPHTHAHGHIHPHIHPHMQLQHNHLPIHPPFLPPPPQQQQLLQQQQPPPLQQRL